MPSEVEICSLALNQIGEDSITSLDLSVDSSDKARLCSAFYPVVRDAVLRAYPWNCARTRQALALLAETPVAGGDYDWTYQYSLPTDPYCLWVPKQLNENIDYVIEGRNLLADEATVTIVFIRREVNTGLYDSLLTETIVARLSAQLAYPIAGQATLVTAMWSLYAAKLREARTVDGMEGNIGQYSSDALTEVR